MKIMQVRCWEDKASPISGVYITVYVTRPDMGQGHRLLMCMRCGKIYAVNIANELYSKKSVENTMAQYSCLQCQHTLAGCLVDYPACYWWEGGVYQHEIEDRCPPDSDSLLVEMPVIL